MIKRETIQRILRNKYCDDCKRRLTTVVREACCEECGVADLKHMFDEAEFDAVPIVHGHWLLTDYGKLKCSKCGLLSAMSRSFSGAQYKSNYCPSCGAKMDGKDGERNG